MQSTLTLAVAAASLMQARTGKHADNLRDLQATGLFSGWSGYHRGS